MGYSEGEIVGQNFSKFYTTADREAGGAAQTLLIAKPKGGLRPRAGGSARTAR
jgi:hypothetical protein